MLNIVLVEPEIPQNTGNIARTCACTHTRLHLVRPFGFEISDRTVKRAGLSRRRLVSDRRFGTRKKILISLILIAITVIAGALNAVIENGEIIYDGDDIVKYSEEDFQKIRGNKIAMIFQDPMSSLNPIVKVGKPDHRQKGHRGGYRNGGRTS